MATILSFDLARARPGIRELMTRCRYRLDTSEDGGVWVDGELTPDIVRSYLPDREVLFSMDDSAVADMAEKASLLALSAVHEGLWSDTQVLPQFMKLQEAAASLSKSSRPSLKSHGAAIS